MPSSRAAKWFADIVAAIDLIEVWRSEAADIGALLGDAKSQSAIERQLLLISEAAIRLHRIDGDITSRLAPEIDWPGVHGMGNVIRHRYDDLDIEILKDVLEGKLTSLKLACERALKALP